MVQHRPALAQQATRGTRAGTARKRSKKERTRDAVSHIANSAKQRRGGLYAAGARGGEAGVCWPCLGRVCLLASPVLVGLPRSFFSQAEQPTSVTLSPCPPSPSTHPTPSIPLPYTPHATTRPRPHMTTSLTSTPLPTATKRTRLLR